MRISLVPLPQASGVYRKAAAKSMRAAALLLAILLVRAAPAPRAAAPSPCVFDGIERIVAVGDVHGAYDRFVAILRTAGLVDERQHWSGGAAHLVQAGDVVDRGPDSRKALDLLLRLEREAASARGAVHALLGNHEVMRMLGDLRYTVPGEYNAFVTAQSATLRDEYMRSGQAGPNPRVDEIPLGLVEMRIAFGRRGEYGERLRRLNTVVKIDGILFVHGGLSPAVADMPCEAINATVVRALTADLDKTRADPLKSLVAREDGPLWYRGLARDGAELGAQVDQMLARQHAAAIVAGHSVVADGRIRVRFGGKVVLLDTGMQPAYVPAGRASALEIHRGVFTAIYEDRRDELGPVPAVVTTVSGPAR